MDWPSTFSVLRKPQMSRVPVTPFFKGDLRLLSEIKRLWAAQLFPAQGEAAHGHNFLNNPRPPSVPGCGHSIFYTWLADSPRSALGHRNFFLRRKKLKILTTFSTLRNLEMSQVVVTPLFTPFWRDFPPGLKDSRAKTALGVYNFLLEISPRAVCITQVCTDRD